MEKLSIIQEEIINERKCGKCNITYPLIEEHWHKDTRRRDGFSVYCAICNRKSAQERRDKKNLNKNTVTNNNTIHSFKVDYKKKIKIPDDIIEKSAQIAEDTKEILRSLSAEQEEAVIEPEDPSKWLLLAVVGDLHWGDWNQRTGKVTEHTNLIIKQPHAMACQVGDLMNNAAAPKWRGNPSRDIPQELPIQIQRALTLRWAHLMAEKLAFFVTGNHDWTLDLASQEDIGNAVAEIVKGVYLGPEGKVFIKMKNVVYHVFIAHAFRGYSQWNENHSQRRVFSFRNPYADIICSGHKHLGASIQYTPVTDKKTALLVDSGGFVVSGKYADRAGYRETAEVVTPCVLLNPDKREMIPVYDLPIAIEIHNGLLKQK